MPRIRDARPSDNTYSKYDVPPPIVTYAASLRNSPLISQNQIAPTSNRSGSAVVNRRPRRNGMRFYYANGGNRQPRIPVPTPGGGGVASSAFQTTKADLTPWCINVAWFEAGYPRNLGYVTRVPQPTTKQSGGPTDATMAARPIFPKVQVIPRYHVMPPRYKTASANG